MPLMIDLVVSPLVRQKKRRQCLHEVCWCRIAMRQGDWALALVVKERSGSGKLVGQIGRDIRRVFYPGMGGHDRSTGECLNVDSWSHLGLVDF